MICPHVTSHRIEDLIPDARWREHGLSLLALCDTIVLHPDWEASPGARAELDLARSMGLEAWFASLFEGMACAGPA